MFGALKRTRRASPNPIAGWVPRAACINSTISFWRAFYDTVGAFRRIKWPEFERPNIVPGVVFCQLSSPAYLDQWPLSYVTLGQ